MMNMYVDIIFWRFLLGLIIISAPVAFLQRYDGGKWANKYILLILLMMLISNWRGLQRFQRFIGEETT